MSVRRWVVVHCSLPACLQRVPGKPVLSIAAGASAKKKRKKKKHRPAAWPCGPVSERRPLIVNAVGLTDSAPWLYASRGYRQKTNEGEKANFVLALAMRPGGEAGCTACLPRNLFNARVRVIGPVAWLLLPSTLDRNTGSLREPPYLTRMGCGEANAPRARFRSDLIQYGGSE